MKQGFSAKLADGQMARPALTFSRANRRFQMTIQTKSRFLGVSWNRRGRGFRLVHRLRQRRLVRLKPFPLIRVSGNSFGCLRLVDFDRTFPVTPARTDAECVR